MFEWLKKFGKTESDPRSSIEEQVVSTYTIIKPEPFGYKTEWLAVKSESAMEVAEAVSRVGYKDLKVYESIDGWVIVRNINVSLTDYDAARLVNEKSDGIESFFRLLDETNCVSQDAADFLQDLSKRFGCVCYFVNHRISDCYTWARFIDGHAERIFDYVGDYSVLTDDGILTSEEEEWDLLFDGYNQKWMNDEECDSPTEDDVIAIAKAWTVDPTVLGTHI